MTNIKKDIFLKKIKKEFKGWKLFLRG
jgi:hypothetical protein